MTRRFIAALAVLLLGGVVSTLFVLVATNGYGEAGANINRAAITYLLAGPLIVLLLAWLAAALSRWLSARLRWRGIVALPLVLLACLMVQFVMLLLVGIGAAELGLPPR